MPPCRVTPKGHNLHLLHSTASNEVLLPHDYRHMQTVSHEVRAPVTQREDPLRYLEPSRICAGVSMGWVGSSQVQPGPF